jgi:hypothetical protein
MQPYQEASQEIRRQGEAPIRALKTAGSLAAGAGSAYLGGSIAGRVMPFLNQYIPQSLAMKGLSKIDPRFGTFINKALDEGESFDNVKEFIKEKIQPALPNEDENTEENIIKKFSPKLSGLVDKYIRAGHPIDEVEQIVRSPGNKLSREVEHMEKSLGMTFYDIMRSIYGGEKRRQQPGKQQTQPMQPMPQQGQPSGNSGQLGQPAQPQGQGQAALMAILQKLQQARGAQ